MEQFRRRSSAEESLVRLEKAFSSLTSSWRGNEALESTSVDDGNNENDDYRGPLGLNLLYAATEPIIDFIFLHGLGGGSRKTWSKTSNPYHYWPKEWLSRDPEFTRVRVHSFGYKANWAELQRSFLTIHDFAQSLLNEIQCSLDIRRSNTKLVLIAHSMGGVVAKQAYVIARQDPTLRDLAGRIHTIFFLATPHRGSDLAKTLLKILRVSLNQKPFVAELEKNSSTVASINDSFRHFSDDLQLWSFYETIPCNLFFSNALIVDKFSATLGYARERCSLLNADHRGICKFEQPGEPNYRTLRNALVATLETIYKEVNQTVSETTKLRQRMLSNLTGIYEPPVDDYQACEEIRVPGTFEWFCSTERYIKWQSGSGLEQPIFWLTGAGGAGKSVLSSHIISDLQEKGLNCSYYFFKHGMAKKASISGCLLSLALQIGQTDERILDRLIQLSDYLPAWEQLDERTLWRQLFLGAIFKEHSSSPHFWVLDALDECRMCTALASLLTKAPPNVRIFITSREGPEISQCLSSLTNLVDHYHLRAEDTLVDLGIFVDSRMHHLPVGDESRQESLRERILAKSGGSFLWTSLVVQELEGVYSEERADHVLNEMPSDMHDFYARMLSTISEKGRKLAHSVFSWCLLAMRALAVDEFQCALKLDSNETVQNLDRVIMHICGNLVKVGRNGHVECVHQTAKNFLLQQNYTPDLIIHKPRAHSKIAEICLRSMNTKFDKKSRQRRARTTTSNLNSNNELIDYAATHFSDHLQKCTSESLKVWELLNEFLNNNALAWIEYLARTRKLQTLFRTVKNLKAYLMRRSKHLGPLSKEKNDLENWIQDLARINARFRDPLAICPSAIFDIVPSLCPTGSMISMLYASRARGIMVKGQTEKVWDECLARFDYQTGVTSAVTQGDLYLAVGLSNGTLYLYHQDSMELMGTLIHGERAKILCFSSGDNFLASSSSRNIKIWDMKKRTLVRSFHVNHQPLAVFFSDDHYGTLTAITQDNYSLTLNFQEDESEEESWSWAEIVLEATGQCLPVQPPTKALFSEDHSILAVSYRGGSLYLINATRESFIGCCNRAPATAMGVSRQYVVDALAFNPSPEIEALVVSYGDGEIVVYDLWSCELRYQTPDIFAHSMSCSPNGRTLVTGSSRGTINIFEFSGTEGTSLTLVYRIDAFEDGIRGISFSSNSQRFADIRGSQCRIWEPTVLVSDGSDEGSQSELSQAIVVKPRSCGVLEGPLKADITSICPGPSGQYVFCGKQDGSLVYFSTLDATEKGLLYQHASNTAIICVACDVKTNLLATADESGRVIVNTIQIASTGYISVKVINEIRSEFSVLTLLLDTSGERILLQGRDVAQVWTIDGGKIYTLPFSDQDETRAIINHPSDPMIFLSISFAQKNSHSWTGLEYAEDDIKTSIKGLNINEDSKSTESLALKHVTGQVSPKVTETFIAALVKEHMPSPSMDRPRLMIWSAANISHHAWPSESFPRSFDNINPKIRQIIAVVRQFVIFLDIDLWVCSIDLVKWKQSEHGIQRHFFLLSEWRGSTGKFLVNYVSSTRDFLIVNKHRLLVIRRGLDVVKTWE
ncbi:WD40 repeat-like protein [Aspergillus stella-maris]|uniref:WD40 repeat-like protein n=1 Tax=Aspergillus stella-maris TaxID=1810926 RepID=UPI003CCE1461